MVLHQNRQNMTTLYNQNPAEINQIIRTSILVVLDSRLCM